MYSRLAYCAIRAETTENTPLTPNVFIGIKGFDVNTDYAVVPSSPILADRNTRINALKGPVAAPTGTISLQLEPKTAGYFLKSIFGAVNTGRYFPISAVTGTFTVGETVTGGTSAATATVVAVSAEGDYLLMSAPTGTFTAAGEAITGGTSSATATLGVNAATVYAHEFKAPQNSLPTFTMEIGYSNEAIRFTGVRFHGLNSVKHEDNVITMELTVTARAEFKFGRVTAAVTAGSNKAIPVDQTLGLTTADTIKVWRPSTGVFKDLSGSGVKTSTISSISAGVSVTIGTLTDALAEGDLLMLAPQTPSYSLGKEFTWIGGSVAKLASTSTLAISASAASIEEFELSIMNELEPRHAANATGMAGRFPTANHLKGFNGNGMIKLAYTDMTLADRMRNVTQTAFQIVHTGEQIGSTGVYYTLDWRISNARFNPFHPALGEDALLDVEANFDFFRDATTGYTAKALLVTDAPTSL